MAFRESAKAIQTLGTKPILGLPRLQLQCLSGPSTQQFRSIWISSTSPNPLKRRARSSHLGCINVAIRYQSSSVSPSSESQKLPPEQQASYDRLRPIIDTFEAPIDWAVAYGSGVMKQAQVKPGDPTPMTDLLISTPLAADFHDVNLRQNPGHYPLYARLMGGAGIGWAQEKFGAGIWYVTMVEVNGISVKYGVISTSTLVSDLTNWDTLYISGRLHKPVLSLISPPTPSPPVSSSSAEPSLLPPLDEAIRSNHRSALALSLLLCPGQFTENYLWEKIAGLSYSGDPRMSVPGAENPEKVKNIVRGPGTREGFREMYKPYFDEMGVRAVGGDEKAGSSGTWQDDGEGLLTQSTSPEHHAILFASLPINLRKAVSAHYQIPVDQLNTSTSTEADADKAMRKEAELWMQPIQGQDFRPIVAQELKKIIHSPALRQSIKGLFTAGPVKSFYYSLAKFRKWLKSRSKT
ncbi:hypothetical protein I317_00328 [Kwoniella heveanensis CBS 569]|nr:hypothetical protein I317_00328 [Kwoniella heveanensis CBS 569]